MRSIAIAISVSVLFAVCVVAAPHPSLIPVPGGSACVDEAQYVNMNLLSIITHPVNWTLVIVCRDSDFDRILQDTGEAGKTGYAFTDLSNNYSYFRGSALIHDRSYNVHRATPLFIVAHEAAHIISRVGADPKGEKIADAIAERLIAHKPYDDLLPKELRRTMALSTQKIMRTFDPERCSAVDEKAAWAVSRRRLRADSGTGSNACTRPVDIRDDD